ncbi:Cytochrome P450 E-class group I, partial [Penicillium samsonianum]|uniref:Cytochrome P450 E-class group I n=1 Tax=Penicillium samsonianum TaxID=1882272 RepID=UPI002549491A
SECRNSDVFKIRVGWYNWVLINTPEAVREIFEKQAIKTSSKQPSPMGHDIVTGGKRMPTMPYGPHWRAHRSVVRQVTTVPMTATFVPSQEFETKQLPFDLAMDNDNQRDFYQHMRRYAFSIIMTNTFGTRVKNWDHPDAQNAVRSQAIMRRTSKPGAFLVDDKFPPLALLPKFLQPGRKDGIEAGKEVLDIKMGLWHHWKSSLRLGKRLTVLHEAFSKTKITVSGGLVEAGFETSAATLNSLVLQLAATHAAQDELMRVVGPNRLPKFEDMVNLPYIRACVKEMLRMNPILAPGIRRYEDQDVIYKNHVIPKGTVLLANTAFLHYDPTRFEKPFEFMPERFLEHNLFSSEYAAMSDPYKRDHFTFSTGRRTCPGARLAESSLDIAVSGMLWAFESRPPLVDGVEAEMILSDNAYPDGGFTILKPFAARFVPKSPERLELDKKQWQVAMQESYELRGIPVDVNGMLYQ